MTDRHALLVNPRASKGRLVAMADAVAARLATDGAEVRLLQGRDADESAALAAEAVREGLDAIVAMGGDGLVHLAVQALAGSGTALGVVPTGTGNDLARCLDVPLRNPLAAADVVRAGHTRTVDLARCGDHHYVTVLASGFDSVVSERANAMRWPRGQMRYNLATLAELRVFQPLRFVLELDGAPRSLEAMLVAVGNGPSYGGGLKICAGAEVDDGLLDVVVIHPVGKLELLKVYPRLFTGSIVDHPAYEHHRVSRVRVACEGIVAYADGERLAPLPLDVEVVPGALTVFGGAGR